MSACLSALTSRVRVLACWQWVFVDRLRQVMGMSTREVSSAEMRASRRARSGNAVKVSEHIDCLSGKNLRTLRPPRR